MAENKQYITQIQDNGTVMISEDVICSIVSHCVNDVEGVESICSKPVADIAEIIGKKNWGKGMKITVSDNDLIVDCSVVVGYGQNVVTVASAAQAAISNALESMANVKVSAVNISVCGIVRQ